MTHKDPYEKLALIYDKLMSHVNYKLWAEYIKNLFQYAGRDVKQVVDISVGTGNLIPYLHHYGFNCYGSDISFSMIQQAKQKSANSNTLFLVSDATQLAYSSSRFDAVLFLYDSLNYITQYDALEKLFLEAQHILKNGGVFIFDMITDILCQTYYNNFKEKENWAEFGYKRYGHYNREKNIQYNEFQITINGQEYFEHHLQRVYPEKEIVHLLQKFNYEVLAQLDDFTYLTANENSERIHYVCLKN